MQKNEHYCILGLSEATLSHYFESIAVLHKKMTKVTIIKNVTYDPEFAFKNDLVDHTIVSDREIEFEDFKQFLLGVHRPIVKRKVFNYFFENYKIEPDKYRNLISRNTIVSSTDILGKGIYLADNVVLSAYVHIGDFVTISKGSIIGHHTQIGKGCTLNQAVQIAGNCSIGKGVTIGMGAIVLEGISIGDNSFVGAGSIVTKDIPEGVVAYGSPAKIIRKVNNISLLW